MGRGRAAVISESVPDSHWHKPHIPKSREGGTDEGGRGRRKTSERTHTNTLIIPENNLHISEDIKTILLTAEHDVAPESRLHDVRWRRCCWSVQTLSVLSSVSLIILSVCLPFTLALLICVYGTRCLLLKLTKPESKLPKLPTHLLPPSLPFFVQSSRMGNAILLCPCSTCLCECVCLCVCVCVQTVRPESQKPQIHSSIGVSFTHHSTAHMRSVASTTNHHQLISDDPTQTNLFTHSHICVQPWGHDDMLSLSHKVHSLTCVMLILP